MEVIAHRGMPRQSRENTLAGFALAIAAGADGIELDVHATRDGVIVVHHDPVLPPPAGAPAGTSGPAIVTLDFNQLRQETAHSGDIPSLRETLTCVDGRAVVYIEIKAAGIEQKVVSEQGGYEGRVAIHSFDHRVSRNVRAISQTLPTGILSASYLIEPDRALIAAEARDYWQWAEMIDQPLVDRVHAVGGRVIAWTVNTIEAAERLRALGVDAVCTDIADVIGPMLRR